MKLASLKRGWRTLTRESKAPITVSESIWKAMAIAYQSPKRHYHTLEHIASMLAFARRYRAIAKDYPALCYAIWFHDFVYDSRANDNEKRSAVAAEGFLKKLHAPTRVIRRTRQLIRATRLHRANRGDIDAQILLDADLAVLAAPTKQYAAYTRAIRKEYAWVPEEHYRAGRAKVLERFLKRKQIYFTPAMKRRKLRAHRNLKRELAQLRAVLTAMR